MNLSVQKFYEEISAKEAHITATVFADGIQVSEAVVVRGPKQDVYEYYHGYIERAEYDRRRFIDARYGRTG